MAWVYWGSELLMLNTAWKTISRNAIGLTPPIFNNYAGGSFTLTDPSIAISQVALLNTDGSLDDTFSTFNNISLLNFFGTAPTITMAKLQSDGKLIVSGNFRYYNGYTYTRTGIARFNSDGSFDTTFPISQPNDVVNSFYFVGDKILMNGNFSSIGSESRAIYLGSISALDGSLDTAFHATYNSDGGAIFQGQTGLSAGRYGSDLFIGAVYEFSFQYSWQTRYNLFQITYSGSSVYDYFRTKDFGAIYDLIANDDNTIYISSDYGFKKLGLNFVEDSTFEANVSQYSFALQRKIAKQSDGKIIVLASVNGSSNKIHRFNTDGTIDSNFTGSLGTTPNNITNLVIGDNDEIILTSNSAITYGGQSYNSVLILNSDGTVSNFSSGTGFDGNVASVIPYQNKYLVIGNFRRYQPTSNNRIFNIRSDNTYDESFNIGSGFNNNVNKITIQEDGKLLVGGSFTSYNGVSANRIIRLNSDGSIDNGFSYGTGFNNVVNDIIVRPSDGKIIVGGTFTSYNSNDLRRITILNQDGSIDNLQIGRQGFDNTVSCLCLLDSGGFSVGGSFQNFQQFNPDASPPAWSNVESSLRIWGGDSVFGSIGIALDGGFNNTVLSLLKIDADYLIAGGSFTSHQSVSKNRIVKIKYSSGATGTVDTSFDIGSGFNNTVTTLALDGDKIIVGGAFTTYKGGRCDRIVRLNADGSRDTSFIPGGIAFNSTVSTISVQSDGKILVGGIFVAFKGVAVNKIVRLNSDGSLDNTFNFWVNNNVSTIVNRILPEEV